MAASVTVGLERDYLRIHVVWACKSEPGQRVASLIADHFDGLGMERDGVAIRVPVRLVSAPWTDGGILPRPVDLTRADHNAIILLNDVEMDDDSAAWNQYVADLHAAIEARGGRDLYLPFASPQGTRNLPIDDERHTQIGRRDRWARSLTGAALDTRLMLHIVFSLREHFRKREGLGDIPEKLFVSHAKADGDGTAWAIVDYVNQKSQDVALQTFYDAKELQPGEQFQKAFEREINRGTLLAIVSDVYDSRPWCVYELTTAKRARRPIVLADVGKVRTSRTFPYGANLPKVRVDPEDPDQAWIEPLLVQALSEGLRCDIFNAQARQQAKAKGLDGAQILPRPPELFDLFTQVPADLTFIYPDPPVGVLETEILEAAVTALNVAVEFKTLGEVEAS